jgi:PAT family beta-lactamase induction signal transducer AmpG
VELRKKVALVAGLYFVEGLPMGIFSDVWPVFLRDSGTSLEAIGGFSLIGLAWTAKALWAPAVDRLGEWRQWIAAALATMALCVALAPGAAGTGALVAAIALFALASATQDIAIDASAVALTRPGEEAQLSSVRVALYRVGKLAFGAGGLLLADAIGWVALHGVVAVAIAGFALAALALPRLQASRALAASSAARAGALSGLLRPGVGGALAFLVFYRLGDLAMAPMVSPFWRDTGASLALIGLVPSGLSAGMGIVGAGLGGVLVGRAPIAWALAGGGLLAMASNLGYAAAALAGAPLWAVTAASLAESLCGGAASVTLVSLLVGACDRAHAGVQFALLTALSPLAGRLVGGASGLVSAELGYAAWFAATGALTLPALAFIPAAIRWSRPVQDPRAPQPPGIAC